ncbi:MAG: carboxypeptidase-like regulatory domain-containing protein [Blautia sp.]|jgi:hypothetical protein
MKGKHKFKERLLAFVLAFAMIMGTVIQPIQLQAAGNQEQELDGQNFENNVQDGGGVPAPTSLGDVGEPTEPGEETVSYVVEIQAPSGPFYPGETCDAPFTATVKEITDANSSGTEIPSAEITWSCETENGSILDGMLTVAENAVKDEEIIVKASYSGQNGNTAECIAAVYVSARGKYQITGTVKDSYGYAGIPGATVKLVKDTVYGTVAEPQVTGENGEYKFEDILGDSGIAYHIEVSKEGEYTQNQTSSFSLNQDTKVEDVLLTTSQTITLEGDDSVKIGDDITITAVYPENWKTDEVTWNIQGSSVTKKSEDKNVLTLTGAEMGTAVVTVTVHGVESDEKFISVSKREALDATLSRDEKTGLIVGQEAKFTVYMKGNGNNLSGEQIEWTITKPGGTSVTMKGELDEDGEASLSYTWEWSGGYSVSCKLTGDKYEETIVKENYTVKGKPGQSITIHEPEGKYIYGDTISLGFEAIVANEDRARDPGNWNVEVEYGNKSGTGNVTIDLVKKDGKVEDLYTVTGIVTFDAEQATESAYVNISYSHLETANDELKEYEDAIGKNEKGIKITPKPLDVEGISFEEKEYDKTDKITVTGITLKLDDLPFNDNAEMIKANVGTYHLDGANVADESGNIIDHVIDVKKAEITLVSNDITANYTVNQDSVSGFTTQIKPKTLKLKVNAGEREYGIAGTFNEEMVSFVDGEGAVYAGDILEDKYGEKDKYSVEDTTELTEVPKIKSTQENKVEYEAYQNVLYPVVNGNLLKVGSTIPSGNLNYQYSIDKENCGELTIIPMSEENARKYIQPDENSDCFIVNDGALWVQGAVNGNVLYEDKKLTLNIVNNQLLKLFENIRMSESQDGTDNSIMAEENQSTGALDVKFVIGELREGKECTINLNLYNNGVCCTEDISLTVKIDSKAPEVTFSNLTSGKTKLQEFIGDITFDMFKQKTFYEDVKILEAGVGLPTGQPGEKSGVAWRYVVLHISADIQEEKLCTKLSEIPDDKWTAGTGDEIKNIPIGAAENGADLEGSYIVAVKTYDRLGNSYVYTSNGMVIENRVPQITIPDQSALQYNLDYMQKNDNTIKISNVNIKDYSTLKEGFGVSSAVESVSYIVFRGNQTDRTEDVNVLASKNIYKSSKEELKWDDLYGDTDCTNIIADDIEFRVTEDFDYNNIWLRVTAKDKAGNEQSKTVALNIDVSRPTVVVNYQNAENTTVHNANYFNGNRKAVMTVKDKNISMDGFYLTLKLTDKKLEKKYNVNTSLSELRELKDLSGKNIFEDVSIGNIEAVNPEEQLSQIRITFVFSGEDRYEVDFECVDAFKNEDTGKDLKGQEVYGLTYETDVTHDADESFVIDKTAPIVKQVFAVNGSEIDVLSGERNYQQNPVTYDIYITEHNFYSEGKEFGASSVTTREKYKDGVWNPTALIKDGKKWAENGINGIAEQWKFNFTFEAEGNYTHSFAYTDLAGNPAVYVDSNGNPITNTEAKFTIDWTNPTGSVSINGFGFWETLLHNITFGLFNPSSVDVEMKAADYTSPINPIQYFRTADAMTREQLEAYNWGSTDTASWENPGYAAFTVNPDEQFIVYTKVTDYAGNYEYFSSDGMIVDSTKPAPTVTITNLSQAQNGIFNEDVTLQIDVEDKYGGNTYSGLERVWYTVSATGNVSASQTIELLNNSNNRVQGNQTFSQVITVPANVYNSNDVKVQAFAVDFSGNQGESEITELKIDVTNPSISVSWDLNNPMNGKYYKETRTATVTVTDRNFDPNNVRFTITNTDGTQANIGGWSSSSNIGVSDSATSTCQVSFPADGDYTFTLGCTDLAGNSAEYGQTDEFTIDKTVPEISVSYDNNNARNGNYYKEARTATVTVREHNFNAADVKAAITASLEGRGISTPSISGFSGSGDVHTATVRYAADGDYTFDVEYTDMAGNQASDYTPDQFTVDLTAPEVEITDVEDKSANNDVVSPSVKATDVNYDSKNVTVTITGANNGKVDINKVVSAVENGQTMKFSDFARQEKMDDLYTLTAKAVDLAGNEKEESILFSVNRYGSVYVLDDDTKEWLSTKDYTYINEEKEVGVIEYNVDTIKDSTITVNRDGELVNLKAKTDYTVTSSGTEAQWKENHYTMKAENFAQEGNYAVILSTQDEAANAMNNTSVKKSSGNLPIEFAVDKTAPTVVISGVEDGGSYRSAERTMTVDAKDNLALDEVSVDIDGNTTVYQAEELKETDGVIDVVIGSANDFQEIQVTASDAAGNVLGQKQVNGKGEPVALSVLVTPNVMVQYYMNKPLFFGSIIGVLAVAGIIIFLVWRRRQADKNGR